VALWAGAGVKGPMSSTAVYNEPYLLIMVSPWHHPVCVCVCVCALAQLPLLWARLGRHLGQVEMGVASSDQGTTALA